jgi:pimeloyl-ACP methyl ester carboxylesterase
LSSNANCHWLLLMLLQGVANYRLDILASDIKGAVAALGHSSCTLVAHDWGGMVAWITAGMYGKELINKLIVMGLPHVGISSTNMSGAQQKRSLYILNFQVPHRLFVMACWVVRH